MSETAKPKELKSGIVRHHCRTVGKYWQRVTFKRETAIAALIFYFYLANRYFSMTDATLITALGPAFNTLTMFLIPIIASAFGADMWAKAKTANKKENGDASNSVS